MGFLFRQFGNRGYFFRESGRANRSGVRKSLISGRGVIIRDSEKPAIFCEMLTIPLSFRGSEIDKYIFRNPGIKNFFTGNPVMAPLLPLSLEKQRQF